MPKQTLCTRMKEIVGLRLSRKAVAEMKDNMGQINSTPSSSQGAVAVKLPDHVLMALPKRPALNRALQRHRKKMFSDVNGGTPLPPFPVDHNFPVPEVYADMVMLILEQEAVALSSWDVMHLLMG